MADGSALNRARLAQAVAHQRVFFLHGALHMFRRDSTMGVSAHRDRRHEPGEGMADRRKPLPPLPPHEPAALWRVERRPLNLRDSLSPKDDHILERIEADMSKIDALHVGIHGDPNGAAEKKIIARAQEITNRRKKIGGRPPGLKFDQSESANVGRNETGDDE